MKRLSALVIRFRLPIIALAGLDYTFKNGMYLNLQVCRGLFSENSREALNAYLLLGWEWKLFHERLKLGPLGLALEVDDFSALGDTWALALSPELAFIPADGVELLWGLHWAGGREGTTLGAEKGAS